MVSEQAKKGIIAQLKAELRANELGFIVSKPTTENCRYDMIIDDGKKLNRIQTICTFILWESLLFIHYSAIF